MSKKYCPLCTNKNNGVPPKLYISGEERCENDGMFLEFYIKPASMCVDSNPQVKATTSVIKPIGASMSKANTGTVSKVVNNPVIVKTENKDMKATKISSVLPIKNEPAKKNTSTSVLTKNPVVKNSGSVATTTAKTTNPSQDRRTIVDQAFSGKKLIGLNCAKLSLETYVSEWNTEEFKSAIGKKAKENRTLSTRHFIICGQELSGKTELAKIVSEVLYKTGIRSNEEPEKMKLKEFEAVLGSDKNMDDLMKDHKEKTVLIEDNLDEAFWDKDGKIAVDANKVNEIFNSLKHIDGEVTLIFEASQELKSAISKVNPRIYDVFYELNTGLYSNEEVFDLAVKRITLDFNYILDDGAKKQLINKIKSTSFADISPGRFIIGVFDEAKDRISDRMKGIKPRSKEEMFTITKDDIVVRSFDEQFARKILDEINSKTGQAAMKQYANEAYNIALKNKTRLALGQKLLKPDQPNFLIEGDTGVGKTTSCKILARLLCACGFILNPEPLIVSVSDLQKSAVGGTPERVREVFKEGKDSLIIIDEAYSLAPKGDGISGNYGQEVVDTIVNELGKPDRSYIVAMLGYPGSLQSVLNMNKGMSRRFSHKITLDDYSTEELEKIFINYLRENEYRLEDGIERLVNKLIDNRRRSEGFGNASGVVNIADELIRESKGDVITKEMILNKLDESPENSISSELDKLNSLVGISEVKTFVKAQVDSLKGQKRMRDAGINVQDNSSNNMIFVGPPGTGKTTVCRLIASLYASLGVLKYNDKIKEISGRSMIAGYVGQTEERVSKILDDSQGGILYIDEVYQLNNGTPFGQSATDALCDQLEARGNSLMVIISGYKDKTEEFLKNNPGLKSRFPNVIEFKAYSEEELLEIFRIFIKKNGVVYKDTEVEEKVKKWIRANMSDPEFGNGRSMRNLAEKCIFNLKARVGVKEDMPVSEYNLIKAIDVPGVA